MREVPKGTPLFLLRTARGLAPRAEFTIFYTPRNFPSRTGGRKPPLKFPKIFSKNLLTNTATYGIIIMFPRGSSKNPRKKKLKKVKKMLDKWLLMWYNKNVPKREQKIL